MKEYSRAIPVSRLSGQWRKVQTPVPPEHFAGNIRENVRNGDSSVRLVETLDNGCEIICEQFRSSLMPASAFYYYLVEG